MNNNPIGVIDSGVGGLTVAKEMMRQLPKETIYYVGDTKRCPYGSRSEDEVIEFTWGMVSFLLEKGIKMLVIACNTATAFALDTIREKINIPVIGVVHPGARSALKVTKNKKIGVIGTEGTINSKVYEHALKSINSRVEINSKACKPFVPLVESNCLDGEAAMSIVREQLSFFQQTSIDTLILGCTHYPLLQPLIQRAIGENVAIISSGDETAREVSTILYHSELHTTEEHPEHKFFTTGSSDVFSAIANQWFDTILDNIIEISL
ncbi:glutamate racemase [Pueribacillus theae]|uniref:Glutamate racemase n=1 Tax=Pueribacillus theae TaxID=2171751 RepID=A0A2U1K4U0_9BACI|nr:glutamate racemase [Pueribacillus theae]PWA12285.1 glutamate racemase [Pueribacillus theae]